MSHRRPHRGVVLQALVTEPAATSAVVDMANAVDRFTEITSAKVVAKPGGTSGDWTRPDDH
ncbi:hypothetical protein ACSDQ9_08270 [Aestuariimicrobium soli]|uniref:hypothetical protein n=1 Tax=Aestuariimicrobium soli TaxID=2035834 RepID=UPI003EB6AE5E